MFPEVKRLLSVLAVVALFAACKGKAVVLAPIASEAEVDAGEAAWTLSLPMLDGYLRYQQRLLQSDAGATVEARAELDASARAASGLSLDDVDRIETMIAALASRRLSAKLSGANEALPLVAADKTEKEKPTPEQLEAQAKALAAREALKKANQSLAAERAQFGAKNVDVLLSRESQLLALWARLMELPELATAAAPVGRK
jgi:hypothetical protein